MFNYYLDLFFSTLSFGGVFSVVDVVLLPMRALSLREGRVGGPQQLTPLYNPHSHIDVGLFCFFLKKK